jgi:hypothetical protein
MAQAKTTLRDNGYVVLKATSYRKAQERQRLAEAHLRWEIERRESVERWGAEAHQDKRKAWDRTTFLYGECLRLGATHDDLRGPDGQIKTEPRPAIADVVTPIERGES